MRILSAKDYANETGYPLVTLCRLIRQGVIPHERRGAGYLLDADVVNKIIADRMNANVKQAQPLQFGQLNHQRRASPQNSCNGFLQALKSI